MSEPPKSWRALRIFVWDRDGGVCQVCGDCIPIDHYECGHKIDRVAGGKDIADNLAVMCTMCNRLKPVHDTIEQYNTWRENPGHLEIIYRGARDLARSMRDDPVWSHYFYRAKDSQAGEVAGT